MRDLLDDSHLVMWFAQNVLTPHPRLSPIPIGINSFAMGRELAAVLSEFSRTGFPEKTGTLLVNFAIGTNQDVRGGAWQHFCAGGGRGGWVTCRPKPRQWSYITSNPPLVPWYRNMVSTHAFTLCPSGNGADTHRVWEALYLRTIPVIPLDATPFPRSVLQELYRPDELPILLVPKLSAVTFELLEEAYHRLHPRFNASGPLRPLQRGYWVRKINDVRARALAMNGTAEAPRRRRCWHENTYTRWIRGR